MSKFSPATRQLLKIALLSSPLLAIFRISPIFLFRMTFLPEEMVIQSGIGMLTIAAALLGISTTVFFQWVLNIYLFRDSRIVGRQHRKWVAYILSYFATLIIVCIPLVTGSIMERAGAPNLSQPIALYPFLGSMANNTIILIIINLFRTREREARLELSNVELRLSTLESRQSQLKQQLQPHFLFNALYTLQLLIDAEPQRAITYVGKLSNLLRSSVDHARENKIETGKELAFLRDYLELQTLRFGKALQYEIELPERIATRSALPIFSLQILAENAIKHNAFSERNPLVFRVKPMGTDGLLVMNNKSAKFGPSSTGGTGLANLAERFRLFDGRTPTIHNENTQFIVELPLLLL